MTQPICICVSNEMTEELTVGWENWNILFYSMGQRVQFGGCWYNRGTKDFVNFHLDIYS